DLRQVLRLGGRRFFAHDEKSADCKEGERRRTGPEQTTNGPPALTRSCDLTRRGLLHFRRDATAPLMMEKFLISHGARLELLPEQCAEFMRLIFFRFGRDPIVERRLEFGALRIAQFTVNPGSPILLKRFHKHPAADSEASCAHRTSAT